MDALTDTTDKRTETSLFVRPSVRLFRWSLTLKPAHTTSLRPTPAPPPDQCTFRPDPVWIAVCLSCHNRLTWCKPHKFIASQSNQILVLIAARQSQIFRRFVSQVSTVEQALVTGAEPALVGSRVALWKYHITGPGAAVVVALSALVPVARLTCVQQPLYT